VTLRFKAGSKRDADVEVGREHGKLKTGRTKVHPTSQPETRANKKTIYKEYS
jgi:hypothetical protein